MPALNSVAFGGGDSSRRRLKPLKATRQSALKGGRPLTMQTWRSFSTWRRRLALNQIARSLLLLLLFSALRLPARLAREFSLLQLWQKVPIVRVSAFDAVSVREICHALLNASHPTLA